MDVEKLRVSIDQGSVSVRLLSENEPLQSWIENVGDELLWADLDVWVEVDWSEADEPTLRPLKAALKGED